MLSVFWEQPYMRVSYADSVTPTGISDAWASFCNSLQNYSLSFSLSLTLIHTHTHTHRKIAHYSRVLLPWQSAPLSTLEAQRPPESSLHTTAC